MHYIVIVDCETFNTLKRLLKIMAYVLKFVRVLKKSQTVKRTNGHSLVNAEDISHALTYQFLQLQRSLIKLSACVFGTWNIVS